MRNCKCFAIMGLDPILPCYRVTPYAIELVDSKGLMV
jgi:hypothetical protein